MMVPHPVSEQKPERTKNFVSPVAPTPKPQRKRFAPSDYDWWNSSLSERVEIRRAMARDAGGAI